MLESEKKKKKEKKRSDGRTRDAHFVCS